MTARSIQFFGENALAYNSREAEVLLSGPAGSGKSVVLLAKCLTLLGKYPGTRGIFVRKTRASLTESGLVTWERDVLGADHPILTRSPVKRRVRQNYEMGNGSEFVVCGLDKPDKALSSDYDFAYFQEATDFTVDDWETISNTRLRTGVMPYQQMMADCNPTTPTHWLYKRCGRGVTRLYTSRHRDNPRFWDRTLGQWTKRGSDYLGRLNALTGARRKRFLEGVWAAAEGLVYDGYDPAVHLLPAGWTPPVAWRRVWAVDWGFVDPLVLQFWALDGDGRMYLYRERYVSRTRVEPVARWAKALVESGAEPPPSAVVGDHDPECCETFRMYTGFGVIPAEKQERDAGIQSVQGRFDAQDDRRPRVFFSPTARGHEEDPALSAAGRPTSTLEELLGYVWDTADADRPKDRPIDKNDHGMDAMRYAAWFLRQPGDTQIRTAAAGETVYGSLPSDTFA